MGAYPEDAEDITQDTVIKFWENIDRIEPRKVKAWLFKVAINNYYTLCRKRKWKFWPRRLQLQEFISKNSRP